MFRIWCFLPFQIKWGGRYQSGVGTGSGEEMEQFFSHMSRLGSTTKNMSVAGEHWVVVNLWYGEKMNASIEIIALQFKFIDIQWS